MHQNRLTGNLLVASPTWAARQSFRPVFMVLEQDTDVVRGVMLNFPTGATVRKLWESLLEHSCLSEEPLWFGGPVSGPVLALHTQRQWGEITVPHGLYLAINQQNLEAIVQQREVPFRMFIGHSNWNCKRLAKELRRGHWLVTPATPDLIFAEPDVLWPLALRAVGHSVLAAAPRVRPLLSCDPRCN